MANQEFYSRIIHKHDTEENWIKAVNFIPKQGEIIIYDKDDNYNYERMKIGDGTSKVNDLPFNLDQISDTIADLGAITIDLEGATDGTPATVDADTFQGYTIDKFVMYNINGEDGDIDTTIDADMLGGIPASEYALKKDIKIEVDSEFDETSENPIQNKTVAAAINAISKPKTAVITLSKSLWVDNEQFVSCSIVTADNLAIITPAPESHITYSAYGVRAMTQAAGSLTFACEDIPTEDLNVNVLIFG